MRQRLFVSNILLICSTLCFLASSLLIFLPSQKLEVQKQYGNKIPFFAENYDLISIESGHEHAGETKIIIICFFLINYNNFFCPLKVIDV